MITNLRTRHAGRTRITLAILLVIILTAAGAWFAKSRSEGADATTEKEKTPPALEFSATDLATVEKHALVQRLSISGSLTTPTQALVKSKVAGQVLRVEVREGEAVARGQVLVQLDQSDLQARLDAATADLEERRARLSIAQSNRDNNQALMAKNFISRNAFDQTESAYQAALAAVRWAEAQTRLAQNALTDSRVVAPIAGQVAKRYVNGGDRVGPDSALLTIVALSQLELEAQVPVADVPQIQVGQKIRFGLDGLPERRFEGRVERINPAAEAGTRAIRVFASVPNADGVLRGGMFVTGAIDIGSSASLPVVPATAVFEEAGQRYVLAIEDGKLRKRAVQLGVSDDTSGLVVITSGLDAGMQVVRLRMLGLKDGREAIIKQVATPSASK